MFLNLTSTWNLKNFQILSSCPGFISDILGLYYNGSHLYLWDMFLGNNLNGRQWSNSLSRSGWGTKVLKDVSPSLSTLSSSLQTLYPVLFPDTSTPGMLSLRIYAAGSCAPSSRAHLLPAEYSFLFLPFTDKSHCETEPWWFFLNEERSPTLSVWDTKSSQCSFCHLHIRSTRQAAVRICWEKEGLFCSSGYSGDEVHCLGTSGLSSFDQTLWWK